MLAATAFPVVRVADDDPLDALGLVVASDRGEGLPRLSREDVLALAGLARIGVGRAHEHVVAELFEVSAVAQPGARRRDVVGRRLALGLQEHGHVLEVLAVPRGPGLHQLQPLALRIDLQHDSAAVLRRRHVGGAAAVEALRGHLGRGLRRRQLERLAVGAGEGVGERIEGQPSRQREGRHDLGTADEVHRGGLAVVASREVSVVRGHDGVGHRRLGAGPPPLADARATGVRQDNAVDVLEGLHLPVALDRRAHLLRAGRDQEGHRRLEAVRLRLLGHVRRAAHVLVGGIGAAADEGRGDLVEERVLRVGHLGGELPDRARAIRGVGPDHVRLQRRQVEPHHSLVVLLGVGLDLLVRGQEVRIARGQRHQLASTRRLQVQSHPIVGGEHGGRGAELRAHVGDRGLAGRADRPGPGADVLDDRVGAAGHGQLTRHVEDHVLGRRPTAQLAGQVDRDVPGIEDFPGEPRHHFDRVGAADTDGAGPEPTGIGGVRVGPDDQLTRERVLLEHHLMNDPGARPPEARAVLGGRRTQEVVDLLILGERLAQIDLPLDARLDEVIAVDRRRHRDAEAPGLHELEHGGLPEHVLQDDAVGSEEQIALAGLHLLMLRIVEVSQQHLVGQSQGPAQSAADNREIALHGLVHLRGHFSGRFDRHHHRCPPPIGSVGPE